MTFPQPQFEAYLALNEVAVLLLSLVVSQTNMLICIKRSNHLGTECAKDSRIAIFLQTTASTDRRYEFKMSFSRLVDSVGFGA